MHYISTILAFVRYGFPDPLKVMWRYSRFIGSQNKTLHFLPYPRYKRKYTHTHTESHTQTHRDTHTERHIEKTHTHTKHTRTHKTHRDPFYKSYFSAKKKNKTEEQRYCWRKSELTFIYFNEYLTLPVYGVSSRVWNYHIHRGSVPKCLRSRSLALCFTPTIG